MGAHSFLAAFVSKPETLSRQILQRLACLLCVSPVLSAELRFSTVDWSPGGTGRVFGISGDGRYLLGDVSLPQGRGAVRWSLEKGAEILATTQALAIAKAATQDGEYITGVMSNPKTSLLDSFVWSSQAGLSFLGPPDGSLTSSAIGMSRDGSHIVGQTTGSSPGGAGFIWSADQGYYLIPSTSVAFAVSDDGNTVAVDGRFDGKRSAALWKAGEAPVILQAAEFTISAEAFGLAADGSVAAGTLWGQDDTPLEGTTQAARWSADGSLTELGFLPGGEDRTIVTDMTPDGTIIIGGGHTDLGPEAFLWRSDLGMMNLREWLTDEFQFDLENWILTEARAISDDGTVLAGYGINPAGQSKTWFAQIPEPSSQLGILTCTCTILALRRRN